MDSTLRDAVPVPSLGDSLVAPNQPPFGVGAGTGGPDDEGLHAAFHSQLNDPGLVLSPGYIGSDRRATGLKNRLLRATFRQRRSVLSLEFAVVAVVVALSTASLLLVGSGGRPSVPSSRAVESRSTSSAAASRTPAAAGSAPAPTTTVPAPTTTAPTPTTAPALPVQATAPAPPATVAAPAPAPAPPSAPDTPAALGAQALTLVRYPWQNIPGYTIQFLPISDAPSAGFYGNTTFTWGRAGGTSVLYVYPGETVDRLAGIIAFEIGHEVDAAAVEPQGGEAQIENVLAIHPTSWAPDCDCAEQGFLSGWYAAAFSDFWSPGVGDWSTIAPAPSGAVLAAVEPWLNPTIP